MSRANRSEAVANALLAEKKAARVKRQATPRWSLPADRALKWVAWGVVALVAWSYLAPVVRGWLA